jgi:hypothetical protein
MKQPGAVIDIALGGTSCQLPGSLRAKHLAYKEAVSRPDMCLNSSVGVLKDVEVGIVT